LKILTIKDGEDIAFIVKAPDGFSMLAAFDSFKSVYRHPVFYQDGCERGLTVNSQLCLRLFLTEFCGCEEIESVEFDVQNPGAKP
jgi:hypothetical protein